MHVLMQVECTATLVINIIINTLDFGRYV